MKLLVANRGEIAIRILRAAAELNIPTVAVAPADDAGSLHTGKAGEAVALDGIGAAAYLDIDQLVAVALDTGCDAIHPGYGFLAENADFARRCIERDLTFVGPRVDTLQLFGDKARARVAAGAANVPVIHGLDHAVSPAEAVAFFEELGDGRRMMIKAVGGGGGRGSRVVESPDEVAATFERCRTEAEAAFGIGDLYVEEFIPRARHVEVQILGDIHGSIAHLGERECSVQRNFQKIIEVAPAPALEDDLRAHIIDAAVRLARSVTYSNAGTFEFLIDLSGSDKDRTFAFIEANARLQVEHTVTEEVTGVDIVQAQIRLAQGATIAELGLDRPDVASPRGYAIQARVNMESIREDGSIHPSSGTLTAYEAPSGPGVRTDGFGYGGYQTSLSFDALLAKVVGHSPSAHFADAIARTTRALSEFRIEGVATNIAFLQSILAHEDFATGNIDTQFVDRRMAELAKASTRQPRLVTPAGYDPSINVIEPEQEAVDPVGPAGSVGLVAPMQGTIVSIDVALGSEVRIGQLVAVVEAMKLQHDIKAERSGLVCAISMSVGDVVREGYPIVFIEEMELEGAAVETDGAADLDYIRGDLLEVNERIAGTVDEAHPEAVAGAARLG